MLLHSRIAPRAAFVIAGAMVMAFISANFLFNGSVLNVIPWGILAFATAFLATHRREAVIFGAIFGFVVSYAFLWFDNTSPKTLDKVLILIPLIIVPATFGLLCGLTLAWLGWQLRSLLHK